MANITHKMTLSTTEPNNNVGLIKVRQADDETQIFDAQITESGAIKSFSGLTPFFCLMAREVTGQGVSEEPVKTFDGAKGTLKYTVSANAMQMVGRNEAYFSFRKELSNGEWAEQFSTRSFYYTVEKSIYTQPFKDSNYWFTFKELYRIFNEYMSSGKNGWEDFVESNREILESIDPGGVILGKLDEVSFVSKPIDNFLIKVGRYGDVESLNEAIKIAASRRAAYTGSGFNIEVRLMSGFILTEQVYVKDQDLSFITITSEDETVEINATNFVNNVNEEPYATGLLLQSAAAFTGYGIAKLPLIDCSFDFNGSGISGRTNGVFLIYGAEFRMARGRKFVNGMSSGLSVMEGSKAYVTDTEFSGFNGNNIACYRGSYVLFRGGKANGSVSGYGVYLDNLCQMDAAMADFSGNNKSNVWLSGQSLLSANNAKFNGSMTSNGLNVDGASVADVHNSEFNNNAQNGIYAVKSSLVDANACQSQNNTQIGLFVSSTANVNASDAVIKNNGTYGVRCNFGGFLNVSRANCQKVEGTNGADIRVDYNGYIVAQNAIGGLSGVTQGNIINQNGLVLNNDAIPEDLGTLGTNIQSRVVFSQVKNSSCASSMIPLSKTTKKTIVIKTVAVHESGTLSTDEIALLSVEKYLDGFCLTTKNSELSAKLSNASTKIYFDAIKTV